MRLTINNGAYEVKTFKFSGGEVQVRIKGGPDHLPLDSVITKDIMSSDDLMEVLMVTDAVRREYPSIRDVHLVVPYFPYARQDRVCAPGEALALKVMANIINAQNYATVTVWDAHSDVTLALVDRVVHVEAKRFVEEIILNRSGDIVLVAPDAGARKRVNACSPGSWCRVIQAEKVRDTDTGEISHTEVHGLDPHAKVTYLIVDDICDGGRTFIELAKTIKRMAGKSTPVHLYVTHGIFSQGFNVFEGLIDHIYVANPFPKELPSFVTQV